MLETNANHQKTAQETVKYEVHGAPLNHQRYEKPQTSRGLSGKGEAHSTHAIIRRKNRKNEEEKRSCRVDYYN